MRSFSQWAAGALECSTSCSGMDVTTMGMGKASTNSRCASEARALAASSCCNTRSRSSCESISLKAVTRRPISSRLFQRARRVWSPLVRTSSATRASCCKGLAICRATSVTRLKMQPSNTSAVPRCSHMRANRLSTR
ncbi:hypothetical protein D3C71_1335600 [compost metagenome]